MPEPPAPREPLHEFVELSQFELDGESVRSLGQEFCQRHGAVVLGRIGEVAEDVPVGMLRPQNVELVDSIERALGRPIRPVRLHAHEIDQALQVGYPADEVSPEQGAIRLQPVRRISYQPGREVRRLVQEAIGQAITLGASDVHFECYRNDVDVRLRIDGVLRQISTPIGHEHVPAAISYLKVVAGLDIAERRRNQDGRILALFDETGGATREIDLRLSVLPGPHGEDAVLRILDSARSDLALEALGFTAEVAERFRTIVASPEGMLLVTGPTGSGKTTTLYSAVRHVNHEGNKLLSVEDPIEYELAKANQKQVSKTMGFADYARAFLRQDPDILMIGEIRDEQTAALAVRAAQTGHLVLSTLHTRDSIGAIPRLMTLDVEPAMIADSLLAVLAQRLVRKICVHCRRPVAPPPALLGRLGLSTIDFEIYEGRGCDQCHDGYKGRIGIFELFVVDGEIAHQISRGRPAHSIRRRMRAAGARTLLDDALDKLRAGTTSLAEVARQIPHTLILEPAGD